MTWFLNTEYILYMYMDTTHLLYVKQNMFSFNLYLKANVIIDLVYYYYIISNIIFFINNYY